MESKIIMLITILVGFVLAFSTFLIWLFLHQQKTFKLVGWNSSTQTWLEWIGNTTPLSKEMGPLLISPNVESGLVWTVNGQNVVLAALTTPIFTNQTWYFYSGGEQQQGTDQWPAYLGINKNQILSVDQAGNLIVSPFDANLSPLVFNQLLSQPCDGFVYLTDGESIYYVLNNDVNSVSEVKTLKAQSVNDCVNASSLFFGTLELS